MIDSSFAAGQGPTVPAFSHPFDSLDYHLLRYGGGWGHCRELGSGLRIIASDSLRLITQNTRVFELELWRIESDASMTLLATTTFALLDGHWYQRIRTDSDILAAEARKIASLLRECSLESFPSPASVH